MGTITYTQKPLSIDHTGAKAKLWIVPIGRVLLSLIFLFSGISHFSGATISYAASMGVPFASVLVPISGAMAMVGGLSVLLGFHARMGALVLLLFMIPITFAMHAFWTFDDVTMAQNQMAHFMKNIAMMGGLLLIMFYGSGPVSVDHNHNKRKH